MGKKVSSAKTGLLLKYFSLNKGAVNKKRKIEKHLKKFPNDLQAVKTLESGSYNNWARSTPVTRVWKGNRSLKQYAHMLRILGYSGKEIYFECFIKSKMSGKDKRAMAN